MEQAKTLLAAAGGTRMHAYVALSLLVGIRTEEARALRWDHVVRWAGDAGGWQPVTTAGLDPRPGGEDQFAIYVWRSERFGGDTKTGKSRRTLALPRRGVEALREHRKRQAGDRLRAGPLWHDHGLVFASTIGTPLSANGVPVESIALLAGHDRTTTTELVYRHEIRPALTQGAEVMDNIFG